MKRKIVIAKGKNDRFGSQYSAQMSAFAYARYNNYIYRFTPFFGDKHSKMASEFCGMKSDIDDDISLNYDKKERHYNQSQDKDVNKYFNNNVINELREMYFNVSKPEPVKCDIAIHIRRGDVGLIDKRKPKNPDGSANRNWMQRYNDNNYYVKTINFLRKKYDKNLKIVIFSQGKEEDFKEIVDLQDDNIEFSLNGDWRIAHISLVNAPILINSISEFSWTAALLSNGIIYKNDRMFRYPLDKWLSLELE